MWLYFIPHCVYHLMRWFPKNNRIKIRVLLIVSIAAMLVPQFYVLLNERSLRYCQIPLLQFLAATIAFTFVMIGFTILFALMDPVPFQVKIVFHVFGCLMYGYSIGKTILVFYATECRTYSTELYWYSIVDGVLSIVCAAFFILTVPFWILNQLKAKSILDRDKRTGVCYEAVDCCSCIWHV
ncbi:uncharacterized protein [Watersipora subatra]|uniref:uncharacterized protein n=1 Tax=Watersipora subatra TaxID=2589382 RepID=UPI00355ADE27